MSAPRPPSRALLALVGATAVLFTVRWIAAMRVGFGDSEALYAAYALHPQPAYLDHPGLIGALARWIGGGTAPTPERAHLVTLAAATAMPWLMAVACRACGAPWSRALAGAVVFALAPEIAVGLFAMTPDLPLAAAWISAIALAAGALRSAPGSPRASWGFAAAGVLAGAAAASKVTGILLMASLAVAYAAPASRRHARSVAPWAGLAAGSIVVAPVAFFETRAGWPMLHHRLVATQVGAGPSWRNAAALVGGQLAYLSPLTAALAAGAAWAVWRGRRDAVGGLLVACSLLPLGALVPLCLWSRVAEPHWIAPGLLALVPAAARASGGPGRRLVAASCGVAATLVAAAHAWVLVPSLARLAGPDYAPQLDIANELFGWPEAIAALREEAAAVTGPFDRAGEDVAVAGPHWVVCAQLDAALRGALPVGCDTPIGDDFDDWMPRDRWRHAEVLLWVTDTRFPKLPELRDHALAKRRDVAIVRDGRTVRVFTIAILMRRAQA